MKVYIYQPKHHFIYITFVVVAIGKNPYYCGDDFCKALKLYDELKRNHRAPQIWDCSCGRNGIWNQKSTQIL